MLFRKHFPGKFARGERPMRFTNRILQKVQWLLLVVLVAFFIYFATKWIFGPLDPEVGPARISVEAKPLASIAALIGSVAAFVGWLLYGLSRDSKLYAEKLSPSKDVRDYEFKFGPLTFRSKRHTRSDRQSSDDDSAAAQERSVATPVDTS